MDHTLNGHNGISRSVLCMTAHPTLERQDQFQALRTPGWIPTLTELNTGTSSRQEHQWQLIAMFPKSAQFSSV